MFTGFPRAALWVGAAFFALLLAARFFGSPQQPAVDAGSRLPPATPPGITLQLRAGAQKARVAASAQWMYADLRGMTLYTYDQDTARSSRCTGECAAAWPPALAYSTGVHGPDWSLLDRADGTRQWAYRGAPLYRSEGDRTVGEATGDGADGGHWHAASFQPGARAPVPDGIEVREIADAAGVGLVDFSGLTLYSFDGNAAHPGLSCTGGDCAGRWVPLEAPEIANPVGAFSPVTRDDGITQWTYLGKPLYRYSGDQKPGDIAGLDVDSRFHIALILRFFIPADAAIRHNIELGNILATRGGSTLYQRDRVTMEELHQFRTDHGSPALGRALGISTCDQTCAKTWPPFTAPADALPSGYWDIVTRPGGVRQWAYKGFALYTYAPDKPGDTGGNAIYSLAQIDRSAPAQIDPNEFVGGAASGLGVSALFWHAVVP
jgi:predicted lipoprotein with Yx(FWY)xxD motif